MIEKMAQKKDELVKGFLSSLVDTAIKMTEADFEILSEGHKSFIQMLRKQPSAESFINSPQGAESINMNINILMRAILDTEIRVEAIPAK